MGRIQRLASGSASRRNLDIVPLEGGSGLFRLRVDDYRVLFSVAEDADTVMIELIHGRGGVYDR